MTLAQATSHLVEDPEFRIWLKAEALKQFDGDYDVLWQHHLDHQFPDGQTLRAKLANALFRVISAGGSIWDSGDPNGKFNPVRSNVSDPHSWFSMDVTIFPSWNWSTAGSFLVMHWIEEDADILTDEVTITNTVSDPGGGSTVISYSFTIDDRDDDLGRATITNTDAAVNFWDENYETASIRWYMSE